MGEMPAPIVLPPHIIADLKLVRHELVRRGVVASSDYSAAQLGQILVDIAAFQERDVSRATEDDPAPPKISWDSLNDFAVDGRAQSILEGVLTYAKEQGWDGVDFSDESRWDAFRDLLIRLRADVDPPVRVHLNPALGASVVEELARVVETLGGQACAPEEALYFVDNGHTVSGSEKAGEKVLARNGPHVLLHYTRSPPSYRRWLPSKSVDPSVFELEDRQVGVPLRISADWIKASELHNEWMDPYDFALSNDDPSTIRLRRHGDGAYSVISTSGPIVLGRSAVDFAAVNSKKRRVSNDGLPMKSHKKSRIASPASPAPMSPDAASEPPFVELGSPARHPGDDARVRQPAAKATRTISDVLPFSGPVLSGVRPSTKAEFPVVLPCYSSWFKMDAIHANEKKSLHELFPSDTTDKSAPRPNVAAEKLYMQQRNFIVNCYRANPRVHLSATACRKMIAGDAVALFRIHNFLEQWGIINYHVDPGTLPAYGGPGNPDFNTAPIYTQSPYAGVQSAEPDDMSLDGLSNGVPPVVEGHTRTGLTDDHWDPESTLRLLNAVCDYGEDWDAVAQAVGGGKSPSDCVERFLRVPIKDRTADSGGSDLLDRARPDLLLPFKDVSNSLLKEAAVLASCLDPNAAAALASKAPWPSAESKPTPAPSPSSAPDAMQVDDGAGNLAVGMVVRAPHFGTGVIVEDVRPDGIVEVQLPYGKLYAPIDSLTPASEEGAPGSSTAEQAAFDSIVGQSMVSTVLRARDVSAEESRSILALLVELFGTQMKKIELKMKQYDEVQALLLRQREMIEVARQEVFAERIELAHTRIKLMQQKGQAAAAAAAAAAAPSTVPSTADSSAVATPTNE
ncbi:unnamed protein product (mitochondrion) [Plasmodiophora brassicae]|uniref:SWIRM domain-containing protein n=2 Tax=Plasmodiophora brassicae TaxID=37360 RepID=A0A3P3YBX5_PLABS|nr:unnamed protein product [Plasmodiophora brassicae]